MNAGRRQLHRGKCSTRSGNISTTSTSTTDSSSCSRCCRLTTEEGPPRFSARLLYDNAIVPSTPTDSTQCWEYVSTVASIHVQANVCTARWEAASIQPYTENGSALLSMDGLAIAKRYSTRAAAEKLAVVHQ